jgi:hypothetical protein
MCRDEEIEGTFFSSRKWFIINEGVAYKRMINCINGAELKNIGKY